MLKENVSYINKLTALLSLESTARIQGTRYFILIVYL